MGDCTFVMLRRPVIVGAAVVVVGVGAWLAFGFFGVQALFIDDEVDEAAPTFDPQPAAEAEGAAGQPADSVTTAPAAPATAFAGTFVDRSHPTSGRAVVLTDGSERRVLRFEDFRTDNGPDLNVYLSTAAPDGPAGAFDDDFVDLGDLKGNIGAQNYEIPAEVDLSRYRTVVVWCVRFSVAFGAAELTAA